MVYPLQANQYPIEETDKEGTYNVGLVDLIELDKKQGLYGSTILSLEARDFYNHYRSINDLEEIL